MTKEIDGGGLWTKRKITGTPGQFSVLDTIILNQP